MAPVHAANTELCPYNNLIAMHKRGGLHRADYDPPTLGPELQIQAPSALAHHLAVDFCPGIHRLLD